MATHPGPPVGQAPPDEVPIRKYTVQDCVICRVSTVATSAGHTAMSASELPAILGGTPLRLEGPPAWPGDWPEVTAALNACLSDGSWGKYHGRNCGALTEELKAFHHVTETILCASGTVAVELALRGVRVEPGDEVILAAYDFKANFQNVLAIGATPVLVDIDPGSWQMDISQIEAAVSDKTKAIIVSHLHGGCVPMQPVMELADLHDVSVIEDACQATGAILDGHRAGAAGHVGVLSFGGSKLMTSGRGGAVMTNHPEISQRIRLFTQRGNEAYPLSEMQAAVLRPQLDRLDERNVVRWESVGRLSEKLGQLASPEGKSILRPLVDACSRVAEDRPAFFKMGLQFDPERTTGLTRHIFSQAMRAENVAIDSGFRSLHRIHSKRRFRAVGELPNANLCDEHVLVLHHPVLLEDDEARQQIYDSAARIFRHAAEVADATS
ncbi:MAG: aminotransferase class V-fold PLP-dependent enzyme [Planctomycetaceae bacterium]|nr:aminotransferase class V-fold PLP-dependent enzyme [Planctomycetaceae bacterium]